MQKIRLHKPPVAEHTPSVKTHPALLFLLLGSLNLDGAPSVTGEQRQWHTVTLTFDGPQTSEDATPNPFTDYRLDVRFTQEDRVMLVPGYYAADGDAANSSADAGNKWRVHFSPPTTGTWHWTASFRQGPQVAAAGRHGAGESAGHCDGTRGSLEVAPSNKTAPDLRALGRLDYVGSRYPRTIGTGEIFFKAGVDAPENFLSYADFDGGFKTDGIKDNLDQDLATPRPRLAIRATRPGRTARARA